jgi:5'-3' exonuclease
MGVPKFFAWLLKKYKNNNIVFQNKNFNTDWFLIDTNCLIHPVCFKILAEEYTSNIESLENKMINAVINYIDTLIELIIPKKGVYIAIDGPVCNAKIKQQRQRRFRSIHDKILFDKIKEKYNKDKGNFWSNSAISPGTNFMMKLHLKIIEYCKTKTYKIIYSSANTPGEGEHKLLDFIKTNNDKSLTYVTYGLDADLIFLMLVTNSDNVYLLREAQHFNNNDSGMNYVSIKLLRDSIYTTISESTEEIIMNKNNVCSDFIFLCYLLGNDFLPHLYALNIAKKGIEFIINIYNQTFNILIEYLLDTTSLIPTINQKFLQLFISKLTEHEEVLLHDNIGKNRKFIKCQSSDPYDKEMFKIDNILFKVTDNIGIGTDNNYRYNYYHYHFGVQQNELEDFVKNMVKHYLIGIRWVTNYYFDTIKDWNWYYPYDYPPFISDINKYLINLNDITFNKNIPITPLAQLMVILPPQTSYLLPKSLRKLLLNEKSSIYHLYPTHINIDFLYKYKYYEGIPLLPPLEIELVKHEFKKYKNELNKDELKLNEIKNIFIFN